MWPFFRKKKQKEIKVKKAMKRVIVGVVIGGAIGSIIGKTLMDRSAGRHNGEDDIKE